MINHVPYEDQLLKATSQDAAILGYVAETMRQLGYEDYLDGD